MSKVDFWAGHLADIEREGLSIKAYAERESVSAASLYQWRNKLQVGRKAHERDLRGFAPLIAHVRFEEGGLAKACSLLNSAFANYLRAESIRTKVH